MAPSKHEYSKIAEIATLQATSEATAQELTNIQCTLKEIRDFMLKMDEKYATKKELEKLDTKFWNGVTAMIVMLIGVVGYFLSNLTGK